ncbi:ribonuclease HII [Bacillus mangrovi]|uniref:Ribonuclease HII n=1 Tax=Metabacillus mangrovi TaxID=1491830 RepID=A0A7X2V3T9_9BACI|nr:ribonuclease HII [Metabacillus mangrovi]MTH52725.1 ribonuclease HII [Metabacillus mangrovi]
MKRTVKEIEAILEQVSSKQDPLLEMFMADDRISVRRLAARHAGKLEKSQQLKKKFEELKVFETAALQKGHRWIAGIDEAGRGPLAGPVVAGAVVLPSDFYLEGLNDSKQLSESKRDAFYEIIVKEAAAVGTGVVEAGEIDRINIYQASRKAMKLAVESLPEAPDFLLIDAMEIETDIPQEKLIKGDARSISIAAASIVAKVTRDRMMREIAARHPEYGFDRNMGYGTEQHVSALKLYGATPFHRRTFSPVKENLRTE